MSEADRLLHNAHFHFYRNEYARALRGYLNLLALKPLSLRDIRQEIESCFNSLPQCAPALKRLYNEDSEEFLRVSVVLPVGENTAHLQGCLESIAAQTGLAFELLVIDYSRNYACCEFVPYIKNSFKNFSLYSCQGKTLADALNSGLDMAKGKNLLFLNVADRLVNRDALNLPYIMMETNNLSFCATRIISDAGGLKRSGQSIQDCRLESALSSENFAGVYRRDFLKRNGCRFPGRVADPARLFLCAAPSLPKAGPFCPGLSPKRRMRVRPRGKQLMRSWRKILTSGGICSCF